MERKSMDDPSSRGTLPVQPQDLPGPDPLGLEGGLNVVVLPLCEAVLHHDERPVFLLGLQKRGRPHTGNEITDTAPSGRTGL